MFVGDISECFYRREPLKGLMRQITLQNIVHEIEINIAIYRK